MLCLLTWRANFIPPPLCIIKYIIFLVTWLHKRFLLSLTGWDSFIHSFIHSFIYNHPLGSVKLSQVENEMFVRCQSGKLNQNTVNFLFFLFFFVAQSTANRRDDCINFFMAAQINCLHISLFLFSFSFLFFGFPTTVGLDLHLFLSSSCFHTLRPAGMERWREREVLGAKLALLHTFSLPPSLPSIPPPPLLLLHPSLSARLQMGSFLPPGG